MDPTKKFDGRAEDYTLGRPDYSEELIDCFFRDYDLSAGSVIADIGSGTGKLTRQLLGRGAKVYGVEPNEDMRRIAESELEGYPNFRSVKGGAEDTTLPTGSVDHITVAQAFHWFDVQKFRAECSRILTDGGKVFLIWNIRDISDPLNRELCGIYERYCPDFAGFGGGIVRDDPRIKGFFGGSYDRVSFGHPLYYDRDSFIARSLSGSYSLKEGDDRFGEYMAELIGAFERYSVNGTAAVANHSTAYIGCIK